MNITRAGDGQLAGIGFPSVIITHSYGETAAVDVMAVQLQCDRLDAVHRPKDVCTSNAGIRQHRHRAAVCRRLKREVEARAGSSIRVRTIGVVHRASLVLARHLRRKHRAAPTARAVRAHITVVAAKAAPVGAGLLRADGEPVVVRLHRVVLSLGQHSGAVLIVAGQILLQIVAAGIVLVVVAVHDGVRGRVGIPIHQIDRVARLQQVGHHLRVRAARLAQHLDLPDLHRALAGDGDTVLDIGDDLRIAAVLYGDLALLHPQLSRQGAGLFLGAVNDGQVSPFDDLYLSHCIFQLEAVQVQRVAVDSSRVGHVARKVRQQRDGGVIRPLLHRGLRGLDGRIHRAVIRLAVHHPRIAGCADAVLVPCLVGAGRAADAAHLARPVDVVGGVLHDGHRRSVQIDAHGPRRLARVFNGAVCLIKVLDGLALRVAVGPALRQHLLQPFYQPCHACVRSGIIDAVGILIGDKRTAADLHFAKGYVSAADVQAALERAALDIQLRIFRIRTCCIRYPDGPALCGGDVHIAVQRQAAVRSKDAALAA